MNKVGTELNHFGRYMRTSREAAKKTLKDVATALGRSVSFISDVEHGRRNPFDTETLHTLADLLQVPVRELMMASAKDKSTVCIPATSDDHLEIAVYLAVLLGSGDPESITKARSTLSNLYELLVQGDQ